MKKKGAPLCVTTIGTFPKLEDCSYKIDVPGHVWCLSHDAEIFNNVAKKKFVFILLYLNSFLFITAKTKLITESHDHGLESLADLEEALIDAPIDS